MKQIIFIIVTLLFAGIFTFTISKIISYFKQTKPYPVKDFGKRLVVMFKVAIGQTKIMRFPIIGFIHALVFWGFMIISIGSLEMIIDGLFGTERIFNFAGNFYKLTMALGDIFATIILISVLIFLVRRLFLNIKRFKGIEMRKISKIDANIALVLIFLLMISLIGTNVFYTKYLNLKGEAGYFPISEFLAQYITVTEGSTIYFWHEINWWTHIVLIFIFANILPYSKHFHVFMSIPNVFFSRLQPLGKLDTMENITKEVKLMMDPNAAFTENPEEEEIERFGVKDIEDITWKNYLDSLACTECGRCTSVCPANTTGKKLSPRKILIDTRARMKEKVPQIKKNKGEFDDNKSLINEYITTEELWACTTCNACAQECPININHPSLIVDMRRYLVMEESAAPAELNAIFQNIENNGAPWQFSPEDRMLWAENLEYKGEKIRVKTMAECIEKNETPEYLFWVSSAGAFDDRYKKVIQAFTKILHHCNINYAVLGIEETDSGDTARRAGNEMLFQMQALMNIEVLNSYNVKKIITCDPHDYNTIKNEYPDLDGKFEVIHHTEFINQLINDNKLIFNKKANNFKLTYHDPCYLGRANNQYKQPRNILNKTGFEFKEMERNRSNALCCGAGGGQMFKEAEKGDKEVFIERTEDAIKTSANVIITACPFCMTMITDGIKYKNKEQEIKNLDIAEFILELI